MIVEEIWSISGKIVDRERLRGSMSQGQFGYYESHMQYPKIEPGPPR
jgi:hypothetical protein